MPAPANPFPLNIDSKIDSWGKLQILQHIHPSLKLTADEINKMIQALEYLNNNTVTGGYSGNVPLKLKFAAVDHSTPGSLSSKVKTVVNAGANYVLADGYTQWFYTHRVVLTNGSGILSTPGGPSYAVITEYFYLNKKIPLINGVASLGVGGTEINTGDLVPLPARDTRSFAPTTFDLGNIGASTINAAVSAGTDRSTPNTATIVFTAVQNGESKAWLYLGQQENVGASFPALTPADFRIFPADGVGTDPAPAPAQRIYKFYDDVDELFIRRREQTGNEIIRLTNASDDPDLTFPAGETRLQAYYRYLGTTNGTMSDYEFIGAPYGTALAPKVTPDTGTAIDLGWIFGNECNMLSANSNSAFTLTNVKPGGEATVLINRSTEPTVTGATKISGHTFQADTDMHLKVKCRQTGIVQYYFLKLT